jgi:hypothetical protein
MLKNLDLEALKRLACTLWEAQPINWALLDMVLNQINAKKENQNERATND